MSSFGMDDELKAIGEHALRNLFYEDFSSLVNSYVKMAEGLMDENSWGFEQGLQEQSNVFSRDNGIIGDRYKRFVVNKGAEIHRYPTLAEALKQKGLTISVDGKSLFIWKEGIGWYYDQS